MMYSKKIVGIVVLSIMGIYSNLVSSISLEEHPRLASIISFKEQFPELSFPDILRYYDRYEKYVDQLVDQNRTSDLLPLPKYIAQLKKDEYTQDLFMAITKNDANNLEMVDYAINRGADINAIRNDGHTPLSLACAYKNPKIVEFLLSQGARVDGAVKNGFVPLVEACMQGDTQIIQQLLEKNADLNATDMLNRTPWMVARSRQVQDLLTQYGA